MSWALPLPVAIPLVAAALNAAGDHVLPRRIGDAITLAGAAAACAFSFLITLSTMHHEVLHWFGGWRPRHGVAIGIAFTADPLGAGMAALASLLVLLAVLYSLTYLAEAARAYDILMLVFCGAMCGFALTGDLFNMFVWFELMGVAAYALAGFKTKELGPLQGAVNMAVTNTIGAYMIVLGLALLYARTGALNLAQIGHALAGHKPDGLVIVALTLVVVGFLVKSAVVPFHLWLADAHAVAPAPVCVLFSGVMVELGLLGVARCYWTIFDAPFGAHHAAVRGLLLWIGIVTALLGALMAYLQSHLKRLLAYSTISHAGVFLVGIAVLNSTSLSGVAAMVISHGLLKGALFLCCGILFIERYAIDELRLHGYGRGLRLLGVLFGLAGVGLIGVPFVGTYLGHAEIDEGAIAGGVGWVQPLLAIASGVSAAAILRAGARVFLGWGPRQDELLTRQPPEEPPTTEHGRPLLLFVTTIMVAVGLVVSVVPGLAVRSEYGAERFVDRAGYVDRVLHGTEAKAPPQLPYRVETTTTESILYGLLATLVTLAGVAFGLWRNRLPQVWRTAGARVFDPPLDAIRAVHTGVIGDYVMWLVVGTAVFGGVWALTLR